MFDLTLEKNKQLIACEISIKAVVDHEVGNVAKCLKSLKRLPGVEPTPTTTTSGK